MSVLSYELGGIRTVTYPKFQLLPEINLYSFNKTMYNFYIQIIIFMLFYL